ncbi:MAG: hypothetical protein U0168_07280 [Nannocystaceae bacterium]
MASGGAAQNCHLPRTWAQMEIAALTRREGAAASARIVALSKDYTVLSRFTSLLVLESDAMYREFDVERTTDRTDADGAVDVLPERVTAPLHAAGVVAPSAQQRGEAGGIGSSTPAAAPHQGRSEDGGTAAARRGAAGPRRSAAFADAAPTVLEAREDDAPGLGGFGCARTSSRRCSRAGSMPPLHAASGRSRRVPRSRQVAYSRPGRAAAGAPAGRRLLHGELLDGEIKSRDRWSEPTSRLEPWAGAELAAAAHDHRTGAAGVWLGHGGAVRATRTPRARCAS